MQEIEPIWIELVNNYRQPLLIGYIYRPLNSRADCVTKFKTMLFKVDTEDEGLIILGDFNIDLMSDKIPLKWTDLKNIF